jgi:hypothetical protein
MTSTNPVESYGSLVERFPGIDQSDPRALGRFAFHAARHMPSEDFRYSQTGEEYQEWHDDIRSVLSEVERWQDWDYQTTSRLDMAQSIVRNRQREQEVRSLDETLQGVSADEGYGLVNSYLAKGGYRIQVEVSSSPLFPEGRTAHMELDKAKDPETGRLYVPYGAALVDVNGDELDGRIKDYIEQDYPTKKAKEIIDETLTSLGEIDSNEFEQLRLKYGAKAAGLMTFGAKVAALHEATKDISSTKQIEIPPFTTVSVDMYEAWLDDPTQFDQMCEAIRISATGLHSGNRYSDSLKDLVVVRSSAVKSEDGDEHSGAGVYKSVAVNPNDIAAFRAAVAEVYASTRSEAALSYQHGIGVTDELMGLVIQQYQEEITTGSRRGEVFYGYADGTGVNPNLIEVHTNEGALLYDKPRVKAELLLEARSNDRGDLLHTHPDHESPLRTAIYKTADVPHAAVLAEQLFGKPMQVEFVNGSIVQVRPLKVSSPETPIIFPDDLQAVSECAVSGFGDMELEPLDERDDNSDKKGFVTFYREYEFTINRGHAGYDAFPKEGAVVIFEPSSSGHIQAICREKGLMCFYPKKGQSLDGLEDVMFEREDRFRGLPKNVPLRFIGDGYDGKVYAVNQTEPEPTE